MGNMATLVRFQIQHHAFLAPVNEHEKRTFAFTIGRYMAVIVAMHAFDLDHLRPQIGHDCGAEWARQDTSKIDDSQPVQRARIVRVADVLNHVSLPNLL